MKNSIYNIFLEKGRLPEPEAQDRANIVHLNAKKIKFPKDWYKNLDKHEISFYIASDFTWWFTPKYFLAPDFRFYPISFELYPNRIFTELSPEYYVFLLKSFYRKADEATQERIECLEEYAIMLLGKNSIQSALKDYNDKYIPKSIKYSTILDKFEYSFKPPAWTDMITPKIEKILDSAIKLGWERDDFFRCRDPMEHKRFIYDGLIYDKSHGLKCYLHHKDEILSVTEEAIEFKSDIAWSEPPQRYLNPGGQEPKKEIKVAAPEVKKKAKQKWKKKIYSATAPMFNNSQSVDGD